MQGEFDKMQDNIDDLKNEISIKDRKIVHLEDKVQTLTNRVFTLENLDHENKILLSGNIMGPTPTPVQPTSIEDEANNPNGEIVTDTLKRTEAPTDAVTDATGAATVAAPAHISDAEFTEKVKLKLCDLTGLDYNAMDNVHWTSVLSHSTEGLSLPDGH